mmetsp:Transcript_10152/g.28969  ORF Transcript_10152/g.28969 Transcript_10152/m.28969 type:complete len:103 (-) Transcript_10152:547-855(-)
MRGTGLLRLWLALFLASLGSVASFSGVSLVSTPALDLLTEEPTESPPPRSRRPSWLPDLLRRQVLFSAPSEVVMLSPFWSPRSSSHKADGLPEEPRRKQMAR